MDRYKEGYNDCNREWKKKIEEKLNLLDEEGKAGYYVTPTQNLLKDLLKKG